MTKEIRRLSIIVAFMFVALFASTSVIQVVQASALNEDPNNRRAQYDRYEVRRGPIIAGGEQIARSQATDDEFAYQRVYEESDLWSGITGWINPVLGSETGLEQAMSQELSGFADSGFLARLNQIVTGQEPRGSSLELTVDPTVQRAARDAMTSMGYSGAVVAIEPDTGRILALVTTPGFDANALTSHDVDQVTAAYDELNADERNPLINRALNTLYAPGSTFKLVVAAAALASGDFTAESTFDNPSEYTLPGTSFKIRNAPFGPCGGSSAETVSLADAITYSCNIPMAQLAEELGEDAIREQAEKFGFGSTFDTPIASAVSSYPTGMSDDKLAQTGYGQYDVRTTPLQVAQWTAAIANDGIEMDPWLVDQIVGDDLSVQKKYDPSERERALDADDAESVTEMMVSSVAVGASSNARIEGVDVAGKTGTAENGPEDPYTLWFTGFAPAENPEVAVAVVVEDGGGQGQSGDGNTIAAPIAKKVMEAVLAQ